MKRQGNLSTQLMDYLKHIAKINVDMGKPLSSVKENTLLLFPDTGCTLNCGICALVAFKGPACENDLASLSKGIETLLKNRMGPFSKGTSLMISKDYLGGKEFLSTLFDHAQNLKQETIFASLFYNRDKSRKLSGITQEIKKVLTDEIRDFKSATAGLSTPEVEIASDYIDQLKDIHWCLKKEIIDNIEAIEQLAPGIEKQNNPTGITLFKRINAVLNSLDRLEVRGRDSAGISVLSTLDEQEFSKYKSALEKKGIAEGLENRSNRQILVNNTISINEVSRPDSPNRITICFVYKFAAEIGALGDNIAFIRNQIKSDLLLQTLAQFATLASSVSAHTRWASIGDITEANCHPLDNTLTDTKIP